jgi:uncharacterized membrane protein
MYLAYLSCIMYLSYLSCIMYLSYLPCIMYMFCNHKTVQFYLKNIFFDCKMYHVHKWKDTVFGNIKRIMISYWQICAIGVKDTYELRRI